MKATILDLRRRMSDVLKALDRNETVTIFHRGHERATLIPSGKLKAKGVAVKDHSAFGIWKDHDGLADVEGRVRTLRKGRFGAV